MQGNTNILPEGTKRSQGKSAQEVNIYVAKLVAGIVKTTLGPKGMDKLLVDSNGDVTVTNDGVTILREMTIENPTAKMMVEIARTQEAEVGDGTTTAVVIAGQLLSNAETLLQKKVHPTVIAKGYKMASKEAVRILKEIAIPVKESDRDTLLNIAKTAMTGKGVEDQRDILAELVVEAVLKIKDGKEIDLHDIRVEKRTGAEIEDTEIINGIMLKNERIHPNMPKKVKDARIALIDTGLEIKQMEMDAKINITDPSNMQAFLDQEATVIKTMIEKIIESEANVVIIGKSIDETAVHFLAKNGILALRRVDKIDMDNLSKATGAKIVTDINDLSKEDIGIVDEVEEKFIGDGYVTFIRGCHDAKSVTILVRGSTEQMTAEARRAVEDALGDIATMIREGFAVGGAGSTEIILSKRLREFSREHKGRIQLAIEAFANAMEVIPETLAENAGLDPIDVITDLRSHVENGDTWPGINVVTGKVIKAYEDGIIEPLKIKTQAIISASEVANMILRIDDVIAIMHDPDELKGQAAAQQM